MSIWESTGGRVASGDEYQLFLRECLSEQILTEIGLLKNYFMTNQNELLQIRKIGDLVKYIAKSKHVEVRSFELMQTDTRYIRCFADGDEYVFGVTKENFVENNESYFIIPSTVAQAIAYWVANKELWSTLN